MSRESRRVMNGEINDLGVRRRGYSFWFRRTPFKTVLVENPTQSAVCEKNGRPEDYRSEYR